MKRTALITIHSVPNYGSVLQTYATLRVMADAGMECDVIDYRYPNEWHYSHGQPREPFLQRLKSTLAAPLLEAVGIHSQHILKRRLDRFRRTHFRFTRPFANLSELEQADWSRYQAVIAGSDQIWNPKFLLGDKAFMLSFVPDDVRKVSLASSFACSEIPGRMVDAYRECLSRFDAITVREDNGLDIISRQLGLEIKPRRVLDPTLLLDAPKWDAMCSAGIDSLPLEPYIVLYGLNYAFETRPYIYEALNEMKNRMGVKRVVALSEWPDPSAPSGLVVDNYRDVHVECFVALMRNARGVVTSSFHGTAFALNFGRPLISIVPQGSNDDRQSSLLRLAGAPEIITPVGTPLSQIVHEYDTGQVASELDRIRKEDISTILKNIDPQWNLSSDK